MYSILLCIVGQHSCMEWVCTCSSPIHTYINLWYITSTYVQQAMYLGPILLVTPRDNKIHDKISYILYINNKGHVRGK